MTELCLDLILQLFNVRDLVEPKPKLEELLIKLLRDFVVVFFLLSVGVIILGDEGIDVRLGLNSLRDLGVNFDLRACIEGLFSTDPGLRSNGLGDPRIPELAPRVCVAGDSTVAVVAPPATFCACSCL